MRRTGRGRRGVSHRTAAIAVLAALCLLVGGDASAAERPRPVGLVIVAGVQTLSPSWSVTTTTGLAGFRVRWRRLSGTKRAWSKPVELRSTARSYTITGLSPDNYQVLVRALVGRTRRNGAGHKNAKGLAGRIIGSASTLATGEQGPPVEEQPEKEPPKEKEPPHEEEGPLSGCTLYASASGNDTNSGTQSAPLRTVEALLEKLNGGQTGCLAPGTYGGFTLRKGDSHGRGGAPVTITSTNPGARATISGRVVTEPGADWLTFSHLILTDSGVTFPSVTIGSAHTSWIADDVSAPNTICLAPTGPGAYGPAEDTLIEGDRIHNCGQPFMCNTDSEPCNQPPQDGYFIHGVYDVGTNTTIRNNYIYDVSSKGVLLRGGSGAVVEHNVIDSNGSGILFGDLSPAHDTVEWNIVTNSGGPCKACLEYFGIWSYGALGAGNVARHNDVFGNASGNLEAQRKVALEENIELDPLYLNRARHEYTLRPDSPVLAYGPERLPGT